MRKLDLMLEHLESLHMARDVQAADLHQAIINLETKLQAAAPELMGQLLQVRARLETLDEDYQVEAAPIEAAIREEVVRQGHTANGKYLSCTYSERTQWDGKRLDALAVTHPEIAACKSVTRIGSIRVTGSRQ